MKYSIHKRGEIAMKKILMRFIYWILNGGGKNNGKYYSAL